MKKIINVLFGTLFMLSLCLFSADCLAQEHNKQEENMQASEEIDLKYINERINAFDATLSDENITKETIDSIQEFLNNTELELDVAIRKFEKKVSYTQEVLENFGDEEVTDDEDIIEKREKHTKSLTLYKNKIIEANLLKTEIARLNGIVAQVRGKLIIGNLVAEKNVLIKPKTFWNAISAAVVFFWEVTILPVSWYKNLSEDALNSFHHNIWYVLLILGLGIFLGVYIRNFIIKRWGYKRTDEQPSYGKKVIVAVVTALAYGVIPCLLIGGTLLWEVSNQTLMDSQFGKMVAGALYYAFYITVARACTRVVLAPWNGRWRLFNISDARAEKVFKTASKCIVLLGICAYLARVVTLINDTVELKLLFEVVFDAVKAFTWIFCTVSVFGQIKSKDENQGAENTDGEETSNNRKFEVILFTTLFALATFSVSLFGYPDLASFIFNRFLDTVLLCGAFVVLRAVVYDVLKYSIVLAVKTLALRKKLLSKIDFVMSLLVNPILLFALVYGLLSLWGVSASFMTYGIKKFIFGFKVGGINISLIAIFAGIVVFFLSITLVRMFKKKLANSVLEKIHMDEGIKHSLLSGISFIGFIISVILAISAMGVDLSNLAVIAGALSVGIGFGLQDIIKNLVSGIIILFERPIKVGDWVILDGEEGKIKQINIRSTELETWNRRSVIIPNATLLSSSLINLTHTDTWQRQSVVVGVSYDSDVELVTNVLIECAKSCKRVAKVPAPSVVFKDFGASSLDFELRFYVANIHQDALASSDVRYIILKRFREEGIDIAYPQLVVHQGN